MTSPVARPGLLNGPFVEAPPYRPAIPCTAISQLDSRGVQSLLPDIPVEEAPRKLSNGKSGWHQARAA